MQPLKSIQKPVPNIEQVLRDMASQNETVVIGGLVYTRKFILLHPKVIEKFVETFPETAHRWYDRFKNKNLGRIFVCKYTGNPNYGAAAYHIAQDLGISGVPRPANPVVRQAAMAESGKLSTSYS